MFQFNRLLLRSLVNETGRYQKLDIKKILKIYSKMYECYKNHSSVSFCAFSA